MSWLDRFFTSRNNGTVQSGGTNLPPEPNINFDSPLSAVDDPTNLRTTISIPASSGSTAGSMSSADKTKLDGIQKQGASVAVSAMEIDWTAGSVFTKTLAAGANTFTFANAADGMVIVVIVTGAASTLTWPAVEWAGGVAPTQTASGVDVYTFVKAGSLIFGSVVQDMQ